MIRLNFGACLYDPATKEIEFFGARKSDGKKFDLNKYDKKIEFEAPNLTGCDVLVIRLKGDKTLFSHLLPIYFGDDTHASRYCYASFFERLEKEVPLEFMHFGSNKLTKSVHGKLTETNPKIVFPDLKFYPNLVSYTQGGDVLAKFSSDDEEKYSFLCDAKIKGAEAEDDVSDKKVEENSVRDTRKRKDDNAGCAAPDEASEDDSKERLEVRKKKRQDTEDDVFNKEAEREFLCDKKENDVADVAPSTPASTTALDETSKSVSAEPLKERKRKKDL